MGDGREGKALGLGSDHTYSSTGPGLWLVSRACSPCSLRLWWKRSGPVSPSTNRVTEPASSFAVAFSSLKGAVEHCLCAEAAVPSRFCCYMRGYLEGWRILLPQH